MIRTCRHPPGFQSRDSSADKTRFAAPVRLSAPRSNLIKIGNEVHESREGHLREARRAKGPNAINGKCADTRSGCRQPAQREIAISKLQFFDRGEEDRVAWLDQSERVEIEIGETQRLDVWSNVIVMEEVAKSVLRFDWQKCSEIHVFRTREGQRFNSNGRSLGSAGLSPLLTKLRSNFTKGEGSQAMALQQGRPPSAQSPKTNSRRLGMSRKAEVMESVTCHARLCNRALEVTSSLRTCLPTPGGVDTLSIIAARDELDE
ncbi:hypothetical protein BKA70DRAFT_1483604 [Coprinopsis sp. MPI-PUGE-AT-0042]|nr:hypothetical protein BKA70DRAFT_1483604 [Coprinopsis sp. MPI-PUGE-AT-0042]